ncbi:MAG: hypothetical protein ACRD8W_12585 [Nitrososphaeraceae archaeon]
MSPTRWICLYCNKTMDSTNFTDFIKESDSNNNNNRRQVEYHGWTRLD